MLLGRDAPKPSSYLWDALRERFTHHLNLQKEVWRELFTSGEQVSNFISGKQFLMPSIYEPGKFIPYQLPNSNAQKRALNITQFYVSNCLYKWLLSNPDVKVGPGIATDEAEAAAAGATIVVDRYEKEFFKPRKIIEEGLQGICWGSYIWRIYPDIGKQIATAVREVLENRDIEMGDGWGQCSECKYFGTAKQFQQVMSPEGESQMSMCPECDAPAYVEPPARGSVSTVVDRQNVPIFDLSAEIVPFTNTRWDLRCTFDESPWAIIRKQTTRGLIQAIFGNVRIPDGKGSDVGLDVAERLAYSGSANAGYSTSSNTGKTFYKDPATIDEYWIDVGTYGDIVLPKDVMTISGQVIPKGPLIKWCPDGRPLLVQGLNEMSAIAGIFKEGQKEYTTQGVWYSKAMSGAGRGLNDLVEVNKILNADHAQIHNYLRSVSTPAMGIRIEALGDENRAKYVGTPGMNIPIISSNLPEDMRMDDIVRPLFQPQSVPGQMFDFTYNRTNELAQLMSHITDFSGGLPGVNNDTATGARITQANSNALFTPPLSVKKEVRQRIAEIAVDLYCKHIPIERYFPLKGKYGRMQGVYLSGASIKKDWLTFEVTQDSELPRNSAIKRDDYTAFFLAFGGFEQYMMAKQSEPEMVQDVERAYGIKAETQKYNVVEVLCLKRIKQMTQFARMTENPQELLMAINPPISMAEDNVEDKIKWFRGWLDTDDGQEAPLHLRGAVELVIQLYFENDAEVSTTIAGAMGQAQAAAMAPAAAEQARLEQQTQQPEAQEPPPQLTPDLKYKVDADMAKSEQESEDAALDRQQELVMQQRDLANKIQLMKLKPKPKPAAKPAARRKSA